MDVSEELPFTAGGSFDRYWTQRETRLRRELEKVDSLAARHQLPDAEIVDGILKVTPLTNAVPEKAETLMRQAYALLPHVKVTDLLLEVDRWTRFTDDFTHLKSQEPAKDRPLLLTVILADAINLGLHKNGRGLSGDFYRQIVLALGLACPRRIFGILLGATFLIAACLHLKRFQGGFQLEELSADAPGTH